MSDCLHLSATDFQGGNTFAHTDGHHGFLELFSLWLKPVFGVTLAALNNARFNLVFFGIAAPGAGSGNGACALRNNRGNLGHYRGWHYDLEGVTTRTAYIQADVVRKRLAIGGPFVTSASVLTPACRTESI